MKYFRVTFIPHHREDKEWIMFQASSLDQLKKDFKGGLLIDVKEVTKEEYDEYLE